VAGGNANLDFTLANEGLPYHVTSSISVGPTTAATMTVQPGVTVRFNANHGMFFGSNTTGTLVAQGSPATPITFTANTATPAAGFWSGISFNRTTSGSIMQHCVVEYGGTGVSGANIALNHSAPVVERCTVRNGGGAGVRFSGTGVGSDQRTQERGMGRA
jgi:hypothetical protein